MLNILWPLFIIISIIYGLLTGNEDSVNNVMFESANEAVKLTTTFFGTICLWTGIMKVLQETSIMEKLIKMITPLINTLFPDLKNNEKVKKEISINIVANMLGLGNAATPIGIKAMKTMQKDNLNKNELTKSMEMFILINTASIQLIPTTVIAIRSSLNSNNPSIIVVAVWIATICAAFVGVLSITVFQKISNKERR